MTGTADGPEMDLIRDAVTDAQARVRFFRLAFGAANAQQLTSPREAIGTLEGYYRTSRLSPALSVTRDLPRREVKLAYLMALCADRALPMGGTLAFEATGPGAWQLMAEGPRLVLDEPLWSVLRFGAGGAGRALRPAEVQFLALHTLAEDMNLTINFVADEPVLRMATR
ncbi:histidine phosphotransferase family protein [Roseicyclus elongatus]|nr:histidine phosphotransferase family protein [Roseibacterium elongatum]